MSTVLSRDDGVHQRELLAQWAVLLAPLHSSPNPAAATGRALLASWAEPSRRYHDLNHLRHVLDGVDELADHAEDLAAVRLAAWYHDSVYRGAPDDETRSAHRAHTELTNLDLEPTLVGEVTRLVRLTATHQPGPDDFNGQVLCDADLAILAAAPDDYTRYTNAVRAEYAHVPNDQFRAGRAAVLRALLDGPSLFSTPEGRRRWEASARANLTTELAD